MRTDAHSTTSFRRPDPESTGVLIAHRSWTQTQGTHNSPAMSVFLCSTSELEEEIVSQLYRRRIAVAVLSFLFPMFGIDATTAQIATPAAYPVAPDPSECVVAPAAIDEIEAILETPVADPARSSTTFVPPVGEPADAETSAEVVSALRQVFACANAGDLLRITSLYTDDFVRDFLGGAPPGELLGILAAPPQPLPEDQKRVIVRFGDVQLLPDGRAGMVIVLDEPEDPRTEEPDYAILKRLEDRWLVDEIHEDGGAADVPVAGTPAA
jgi:hypothetical protein